MMRRDTTPSIPTSHLMVSTIDDSIGFTSPHDYFNEGWHLNISPSSPSPHITKFNSKLDLKDTNLKLDDFCSKVIQRAKSLSHYLNVIKDNNNTNNIKEVFGKATAENSPTALLNINETYANLQKRAKNSFYSQLITSIRDLDHDIIHTSTAE
ncbi:unnamed protein product [Ambrosiozyma monospora]|uniref:Unnamed protein product n=1 Tax=Ambrosiozyma monospora TaxID=43982 RepID=A0A9W6Z0J1_AMBMO|nr:unnamed protein product [Ambrosiozyma monospora]